MKTCIIKFKSFLFPAMLVVFTFAFSAYAQQANYQTFGFDTITHDYGVVCQFKAAPAMDEVVTYCSKYIPKEPPGSDNINRAYFKFNATTSSYSLQMVIHSDDCASAGFSAFKWAVQDEAGSETFSSGDVYNRKVIGLTPGHSYLVCYNWESDCKDNTIYPYVVNNAESAYELISFSSEQDLNKIKINWNTLGETGIDHFELERSMNNSTFSKTGDFTKVIEKNGRCNYSFSELNPTPGTAYYRLKQFATDGSFSYSKTTAIHFVNREDQVKVIPKVVKNDMFIKYYAEEKDLIILKITDTKGNTIISQPVTVPFEGLNLLTLNTNALKAGTYTANLMRSDKTIATRFTKE